jgi:hypothetical protein
MVSGACSYDCLKHPKELSPEPDITGIGVGVPIYSSLLLESVIGLTKRRSVSHTLLQLV